MVLSLAAIVACGWLLHESPPSEPREDGDRAEVRGRKIAARQAWEASASGQTNGNRCRALVEKLLTEMDEPGENGCGRFLSTTSSLSGDDFAALLVELRARNGSTDERRLFVRVMEAWARMDPEMASSFLEAGDSPDAYRMVASVWAHLDVESAAAWIRPITEPTSREQAWIGLGGEVALKNPRQAIEFAREAGVTPACSDFVQLAAGAWAKNDATAAIGWARQVEDAALREQLLVEVAISWADTDPSAAAGLVIDSVDGGMLEENALVGIAQRIAFQDLHMAREWVGRFPEGRLRERAEGELDRISERMGRVANSSRGR